MTSGMPHPKRAAKHSITKSADSKRPAKDAPSSDSFAVISLQVDRAFKDAAKAAVAENDALGIATHGAKRGKLVVRAPVKRGKAAIA